MHIPTYFYWVVIKYILRYLKGTTTYDLHTTHSASFTLHGFIDTDWASGIDDRKSMGGYLVFFGQTPISWKSGSNIQLLAPLLKLSIKP